MNRFLLSIFVLSFLCVGHVLGQMNQPYNASFKLTYDRATEEYTFWLVPNYSTPNPDNPDTQETWVGVSVTLMVPNQFTIESYTGLVSNWGGSIVGGREPVKFGPDVLGQDRWPLDKIPAHASYYHHYLIPFSTYDVFTSGVPIPSFRFKGNGCFGDIKIIENDDPAVKVFNDDFHVNWENYFTSKSVLNWLTSNSSEVNNLGNHYFGNLGLGVSCFLQTELVARPDTFQVAAGSTSAQFNVLFNDDKNRIPVIVRDTKVRILKTPLHGNWTVLPNGDISYTTTSEAIPSFSFQYEVCLLSEPAVCDTVSVVVQGTGEPVTTVRQCQFEESILTVPDGWIDIQWFHNGNLVASSPSFVARESGRYTVRASNQTCPAEGCLPVEVITEICCPNQALVPTRALKTRR